MVCWMYPRLPNGRKRRRRRIVGEECDVVVRRIEIRMVEDIERIEVEAQAEAFVRNEFLAEGHVKAQAGRDRGTGCGRCFEKSDS